jgi:N-acetylneuraminic acid mutarotase
VSERSATEWLGERRRQRERERRVRRRRRRAGLGGLAVLCGAVVAVVLALGGGGTGSGLPGSPSAAGHAPGRTVAVVSLRVGRAGRLAAAIEDAAVAAPGGVPLVLGGIRASGSSTAAVLSLRSGRDVERGPLPEPQHDAQAAVLGREVYVFGGGVVASYDHILRYDPATGRVTLAGHLPSRQSDVAVATIGATAYVVGGFDGTAPLDTIVAWRPGRRARVVARLPFGLRYASVAAVGGRLTIAGGTLADGVSDAILTYDPHGDGAVVQTGVLPRALTHASAVALGGRIYLVGGRTSASGGQTAEILEIDPASSTASVVGSLPAPLSDAAVVAAAGRIVVAGGQARSGSAQRAVFALTPLVRSRAVRAVSAAVRNRRALDRLTRLGYASTLRSHPTSIAAYEAAALRPGLPGYLLIADRGNNRILVVDPQGKLVWRFPNAADLAAGRRLHFNDDTFVEPGGRSLIANEEDYGDIVSVDIASRRLTVLFGVPGVLGGGATHLNYPDDAYELGHGTFTVADAYNCRILFVRAHRIIRQYGRSGVCRHDPPLRFGAVNGDTPTPYGGVLVSEIPGHWVDAINADGRLRWSVQAPVGYPSDPQPLPHDHVLLADYSRPGHIVVIDRHGRVLWRYGPSQPGEAALNHPSLALQLPNGDVAVNDDYRDRVIVIDPRSDRIVWQYGHTDVPGTAPGYLNIPDGMDFVPAAPGGGIDWAAVVHP